MATTFFTEVVDPANAAHGQVSLALDPGGSPLLAYTTPSGDVMLARRGETQWQCERLPSEPAAHDSYRIGLAVDSGLNLHVAYQSRATDHLIYGMRRAHEAQWNLEEVPTSAGLFPDRIRFPSMTVNPGVFSEDPFAHLPDEPPGSRPPPPFKDRPHFAYQAGLRLWHATKMPPRSDPGKPATWRKNVAPVDTTSDADDGWFPALTVDRRNETLRIAHFHEVSTTSIRRLHVATMTSGTASVGEQVTWHDAALNDGHVSGEHPSMEHFITGESVVSYYENQGHTLNVCIFGNFPESPAIEVVADHVDDVGGRHSACGVGFPGNTCVVYGSGGRLMFARRTGIAAYDIQDVEAGGAWSDLKVDDVGSLHVAHIAAGTLRYGLAT